MTMLRAADEELLDSVFHALSNRTRRALLHNLSKGPARVGELAEPFGMSLNAVSKHLFVLERAGLIERMRNGAIQSCAFAPAPMASAEAWLSMYRNFWADKLDRLAGFVEREEK
jgi:DNA-binding transcriptional ArsR family regulator